MKQDSKVICQHTNADVCRRMLTYAEVRARQKSPVSEDRMYAHLCMCSICVRIYVCFPVCVLVQMRERARTHTRASQPASERGV
jgi:hypothetical protein